MADHWKSTPSYWCKFCTQYVRDTPFERKNHEASGRHQGNIQRSLRELHKNKAREDRDKQRAKDEVARLNALVGEGEKQPMGGSRPAGYSNAAPAPGPTLSAAAQRKAHAEQLLALGVELPDELKREITGVGGWQTISEKPVQSTIDTSLAGILKQEEDRKDGLLNKGVHTRKVEGAEDEDGEAAPEQTRKRKVWGSTLKSYPGKDTDEDDGEDLDALLSGVGAKKQAEIKKENEDAADDNATGDVGEVKTEGASEEKALADIPPPVVFKKRKVKK